MFFPIFNLMDYWLHSKTHSWKPNYFCSVFFWKYGWKQVDKQSSHSHWSTKKYFHLDLKFKRESLCGIILKFGNFRQFKLLILKKQWTKSKLTLDLSAYRSVSHLYGPVLAHNEFTNKKRSSEIRSIQTLNELFVFKT